jgi:hypothetical protein
MAVNLSPVGGVAAQFFDNSGNVLTGGKLLTYAAGTTTPQITYTTSAGNIPQPNPIILNASGRVPGSGEIWLTDGIAYKFVLTDSNDVLIATYDNITGINSNFVNFTNQQEIQTATAGQTVFNLISTTYQPGTNSLSVFVDGVNQYGPGAQYAYTETDQDTVTFVNGLHVGALVKFTTSQLNTSAGGNAGGITYTPPYTDSVATSVENKLAEFVSVKDFGATGDGVTDDLAAFNDAAAVGTTIYIPKGDYLISAPTASAFWYIQDGVTIVGLPDINGTVNDTSRLTGRVFHIENDAVTGIRVGDSDPWIEAVRSATVSISEFTVTSSKGQIALLAGSRTSDDLTPNFACIGIAGYGINNNTTNPEPSWASYFEGRRSPGAGAAYCSEMDLLNTGTTFDLTPYTAIDATTGQTVNLWLSCGGGDVALGGNPNSAAMTVLPNPATFKRGIVFRYDALDGTTNEAITMAVNQRTAWYNNSNVLNSYIDHRNLSLKTEVSSALGNVFASTKWRDGGAASQSLDSINRHDFIGCSGSSTNYAAGFAQCIQRTNFATGNARFSYDVSVKNADGTSSEVSLNGFAEKAFAPTPDNTITLGAASFRWSEVYAANGTINTSDEREKTDIKDLTEAERKVAVAIKGLIKSFKFKDAVAKKGDKARTHFGVMAQQVAQAFENERLNPNDYALFCYDEWEADESLSLEAGSRYGIRYEELLAFVISAL